MLALPPEENPNMVVLGMYWFRVLEPLSNPTLNLNVRFSIGLSLINAIANNCEVTPLSVTVSNDAGFAINDASGHRG